MYCCLDFLLDTALDTASLNLPSVQNKNYYKSISENKEIIKLVSVLSSSINSTKRVRCSEGILSRKTGEQEEGCKADQRAQLGEKEGRDG